MTQERMKKVAEMIAVFARSIAFDRTTEERIDTLWLIRRYCEEYEQLINMEEEE